MIEVRVRDQHEIYLGQRRARERTAHEPPRTKGAEPQVHTDAVKQNRIRKNPNTVEVDENRRVPEPCESHGVVSPRLWMRRVRSSRNVLSEFGEALSKKGAAPRGRAAELAHW